jgi:hypothetical protein
VGLRQFWQQVRGGDDPVENGPERAPVGFTRESWRERVDIFRAAYDDVVSFNRHYDERLRTLITALSFLTVAGITLFIFNPADASHPADLTFDGHSWNAANVFFLTFMVAVASSLASAVTGMDPTSHRPHFVGEKPNSESMLYYEAIAAPAATWQELRDATPLQLQRHLAESYRRDAEALARRARHKVLRTGIAQAYMSVAVIALVLLAIVRLPDSGAQRRADLVLLAILLFASIPFFTYRFFRAFPDAGSPSRVVALLIGPTAAFADRNRLLLRDTGNPVGAGATEQVLRLSILGHDHDRDDVDRLIPSVDAA